MSLSWRRMLLSLLLLAGVGLPARAEHGVYDEAHLFSHEKVIEAEGNIDDLRHQTHKDLLIETITSAEFLSKLSAEDQQTYHDNKGDREGRADFIKKQAEKRAKDPWQVNGVYVLLIARSKSDEEPKRGFSRLLDKLEELTRRDLVGYAVIVWPTPEDPNADKEYNPLREWLAKVPARTKTTDKTKDKEKDKELDKNQDKVLQEIVADVSQVLKSKAGNVSAETFRWTHVLWAAVALCGVWLVLGLLRSRTAARQEATGPVAGANQPFASLYGTAGVLSLMEDLADSGGTGRDAAPRAEIDSIAAGEVMHPEDQDAISRPPGPLPEEGPEAAP